MTDVTVKEFADVVGIPIDRLLSQLSSAGIKTEKADDKITDKEKTALLTYLRGLHGAKSQAEAGPTRITLKRKAVSEIRQPVIAPRTSAGGRATQNRSRTINVEVRKKRTYVKREEVLAEEEERLKSLKEERQRELEKTAPPPPIVEKEPEVTPKPEIKELVVEASTIKQPEPAMPVAAPAATDKKERKDKKRSNKPSGRAGKRGEKELHIASNKTARKRKPIRKARRSGAISHSMVLLCQRLLSRVKSLFLQPLPYLIWLKVWRLRLLKLLSI